MFPMPFRCSHREPYVVCVWGCLTHTIDGARLRELWVNSCRIAFYIVVFETFFNKKKICSSVKNEKCIY